MTYIGILDDEAFESYLQSVVRVLTLRQPYVVLADAVRAGAPSARQRRRQAEVIRDHREELARYCRGSAFVIQSPLVRGALTAILWLQSLPYEHRVFSSRKDAMAFLGPLVERP